MEKAERELRASFAILDAELGVDSLHAAWALMALVDNLDRQHRSEEAEPLRIMFARRASRSTRWTSAEWLEVVLRPRHQDLARAIAAMDEVRVEPALALPKLGGILAACRERLEPGPRAAVVANYLGSVGMDLSNNGAHSGAMRPLFEYVDETMGAAGWRSPRSVYFLARHCYLLGDFAAGERVVSGYFSGPEVIRDPAWGCGPRERARALPMRHGEHGSARTRALGVSRPRRRGGNHQR